MANNPTHVPLPAPNRPWFLIPADDSGAFHYFVTHLLSSKYRKQRVLIKLLRLWVGCGGAKFWPFLAKLMPKMTTETHV
jgi:hypothetical protein